MPTFLSDEKQTHLSHIILQCLERSSEGKFLADSTNVLREIKRILTDQMTIEQQIDQLVRSRLHSYSRRIPEGSTEWDVLYQKTYLEELRKRRMA